MARILIVDDEPLIAMLSEEWLAELGHEAVGPAHDLASAMKLADTTMDGAILDVSLGVHKSYDVARRLRDRGIPLAFATGHAPEALSEEFTGALTLAKPFSFEAFRAVVTALASSAGG